MVDLPQDTQKCAICQTSVTIKAKSTSFDQPDPEWKYLSHFSVSKGRRNTGKLQFLLIILKGVLLTLLLPHCLKSNPWTFHRLWKMCPKGRIWINQLQITQELQKLVPRPPKQLHIRQRVAGSSKKLLITTEGLVLVAWEPFWIRMKVKYTSAISQYELQKKMDHPLAFAATTNPDILYAHKTLKAPDRQKFIDGMEAELSQHETRGNFVTVKKEDILQATS